MARANRKTSKNVVISKPAKSIQSRAKSKTRPGQRLSLWHKFAPLLMLYATVVMFGMVFVFSAYDKNYQGISSNADLISPTDLGVSIVLTLLTAAFVTAFSWLLLRRERRAILPAALIMTLFSVDYEARLLTFLPFLRAITPFKFENDWPYSLILLLLLVVLSIILARLLIRLLGKWRGVSHHLTTILTVTAIYLFAVSAWPVLHYMWLTRQQLAYRAPALSKSVPTSAKNSAKPDIYYIILDRYTNNEILKSTLGFDNSPFLNNLRQDGYYINDNAYSTYPFTSMSVGSTLSANFLDQMEKQFGKDKFQSQVSLFNLSRYSVVAQELKEIGYLYDVIGNWYGVTDKAPLADNFMNNFSHLQAFGINKYMGEFENSQFYASPFLEFAKVGVKLPGAKTPLVQFQSDYDEIHTKSQLDGLHSAAVQAPGGRFIFAHILVPHEPFVFNADGSVGGFDSGDNDNGKPIGKKYTDQIEFINSQMSSLLTEIKQKSGGKAVVVLQSDEGYYPQILLGKDFNGENVGLEISADDMRGWSDQYLKAKFGVLAAYHLPGVSEAELQQGADSTNIFRLILNHYFGYSLDYLPKCHFGFDEGRVKALSYTDLTPRLVQNPDTRCSQYHD